jgi:hypothetical protein
VLGIKAAAVAFSPAITHRETANFIRSMLRRAMAANSLTAIQFDSGDRFFPHRYCGALQQEIPLTPALNQRGTSTVGFPASSRIRAEKMIAFLSQYPVT